MVADVSNRTLRILERDRWFVVWPKPIPQNEYGDTDRIQPLGNVQSLAIGCELAEAAAGTDDNSSTRRRV